MRKHVFGPVPSRRLGISLGVDMVRGKSCNLNCVFCECGATKEWTNTRQSFFSYEEVLEELDGVLAKLEPNYITFSGSGEPTLSKDLGKVISYIKERYSIPVAVITNSTLLHEEEVLEAILQADLIMPSLHSVKQELFEKIGRPDPKVRIEDVLEGLQKLSRRFLGKIDLELFLIEDCNCSWEDLKDYASFVKSLNYHSLQLNTLARRGVEPWVEALSQERLEEIRSFFLSEGLERVEIIPDFSKTRLLEKDVEGIEAMEERRKYSEEELKKIYK